MASRILIGMAMVFASLAPSRPAASAAAGWVSSAPDAYVAPGPALPADLDAIEQAMKVYLPDILMFEETYIRDHGHFFQGLASHSTLPDTEKVAAAPDNLSSHPTDQPATLATFWQASKLPAITKFALTVDVYDGPRGQGYTLTVATLYTSKRWQRVINVGPETEREQEWKEVVATQLP